ILLSPLSLHDALPISSGTLSGTTTVAAVNGVATFANLNINNPGTGYTLTASATNLTGASSSGFNLTAPITAGSLRLSVAVYGARSEEHTSELQSLAYL